MQKRAGFKQPKKSKYKSKVGIVIHGEIDNSHQYYCDVVFTLKDGVVQRTSGLFMLNDIDSCMRKRLLDANMSIESHLNKISDIDIHPIKKWPVQSRNIQSIHFKHITYAKA